MTKPITPNEVSKRKTKTLPDEVIIIFNDLIAREFDEGSGVAVIRQDDLVQRIVAKLNITRAEVFDWNLLEVEGIYKKAGWTVKYDKPGFSETYEPTFEFKRRRSPRR